MANPLAKIKRIVVYRDDGRELVTSRVESKTAAALFVLEHLAAGYRAACEGETVHLVPQAALERCQVPDGFPPGPNISADGRPPGSNLSRSVHWPFKAGSNIVPIDAARALGGLGVRLGGTAGGSTGGAGGGR